MQQASLHHENAYRWTDFFRMMDLLKRFQNKLAEIGYSIGSVLSLFSVRKT